jgi:universal stress protein E
MSELKQILVGVDLLQSRQGAFSPPVAEAIKQATGLAERISGQVMFFTALDLPEAEEPDVSVGVHERIFGEVEVSAKRTLRDLVEQASQRGVQADAKWVIGRGWIELTKEAIEQKYDLVVVGTRNLGAVRRTLFGSTAMKLVHNCPVPVWVAKPEPDPTPKNLLVASDFSEVSNESLRLGLRIASATGAKLHLLHVIEDPYARLWEAGLFEARYEELRHKEKRAAAERRLKEQLARLSVGAEVGVEVSIANAVSSADHAIAEYIKIRQIDLLVAGTSGRRGLTGSFIGNTAERLLTTVNCSLLAVKPADFVCPVRLESYPYAQPTAYL